MSAAAANAKPVDAADLETEIQDYLSKKGAVAEFSLVENRGLCRSLLFDVDAKSEVYSYRSIVKLSHSGQSVTYLVCVEASHDGGLSVEYFPEG